VLLLETLLQQVLVEHVDYAVELGLQSIPSADTKSFPKINFLDIVRRSNAIVALMEKLFEDSVIPLVM